MRKLALIAALALSACSNETEPEDWRFPDPAPDAASLDLSCSTPAAASRATMSEERGGVAATCPPEAEGWWTYDPPAFHCEWRCVSYACDDRQDVRIDFAPDSHILAVMSGPSAFCD